MKDFPRELRHGSGVMMTLDPTRLLLALKNDTKRREIEARLQNFKLTLEDAADSEKDKRSRPFDVVNHTNRRYWVRSQTGEPIDEEVDHLEGQLTELDWVGPVYRLGHTQNRGGLLCPLPNVLLIKVVFKPGEEQPDLDARFKTFGLTEVREKSAYLGDYHYFEIPLPQQTNAYQLQELLLQKESGLISEVHFENMPMIIPIAIAPNDTHFALQWNMTRIQAGGPGTTGWDLSTGTPGVVICVLDQGCDLAHPDLNFAPGAIGQGINLSTMMPTGAPTGPHGTACAGLALATFNNMAGIAGVAGGCSLMPVAFQNWTDVECAAGINWAANNGARVISMSFGVYAPGEGFGPTGWNFGLIDPAIANAVNVRGCVLCAATGNENTGVVNRYPGRHPLVIAVGGSDQADNRKAPTSADGECWGANFGPGISVVAPCVLNPTTDQLGANGYNVNNGGPLFWTCVNYPVCGDAGGNYFFQFNGTSAATPHVAGLAAVISSLYPALTNLQIRNIIERSAQKVGGVYADVAGFPNGTRTAQMGYGRINLFRALDLADVMVKDWPGDTGVEPSTPPANDFWDFSDIVIRPTDDNVFVPGDPEQSRKVERGQVNYLYVDVRNNGPREARNVSVTVRITPYVGLQFVYPTDWTNIDATHVSPTPVTATFSTIAAGSTARAKFTISAAQVDTLWGWISGMSWHPCVLALVTADNDYAFATSTVTGGDLIVRRNNLAQRNLTVVNLIAGAAAAFPFLAGNVENAESIMEIVVDRHRLPRQMSVLLALDDDLDAFPLVDLTPPRTMLNQHDEDSIVFLERTRVEIGSCRGVMTVEKGTRFDCCSRVTTGKVKIKGGEIILRDGRRFAEIREDTAVIRIEKQPNQLYPFSIRASIPVDARQGDQYVIKVAQRNEKEQTVGGATVIYQVE